MIELPPLPPEVEEVRITWRGETEFARAEDYYHTQDQMRAYGAACAAAALEAAAQVCEKGPTAGNAKRLAAAIRALAGCE